MKERLFLGALIALLWSAFQLYAGAFGLFHLMLQRPLHVAFALMLTFVLFPIARGRSNRSPFLNYLPTLLSLSIAIFYVVSFDRISVRMELVDRVFLSDKFFGFILILLILEACRRTTGMVLPIVGLVFILYGFAGPYIPGILGHRGMSFERLIDIQCLSAQGIFSEPVGVSAEIVFYFVLFGAFLDKSGCGRLFGDFAYSITGRTRGGPAKAAVVSSSLFGMISGSAVGNVAVTGTFTIPLMKKAGYQPHFAGAIEATASTGGQIMPPVMGAAAFLMADLTGIPYSKIIIAAAVPAILYYLAIFLVIDLRAWQRGLKGDDTLNLSELRKGLLQRIHLIVPLFVLVYMIMSGFSLMRAGFLSMLSVFIISFLRRATMMGLKGLIGALEKGCREAIMVAVPSAVAGLIVGVIVYTGLGLKFTGILMQISGGQLLPALFFTMLACIILGMGMPTSAAYLLAAVLMAPGLMNMGVPLLVAHMFVFYFAVMSMITPPVALATYAAASIAESGIWQTGIMAFRMAFASFLIPYAFIYNHGLLLRGSLVEILWVIPFTSFGICALAAANIGFLYTRIQKIERIILFISSLLLIHTGKITDLLGLVPAVIIVLLLRRRATEEKHLGEISRAVS
jgi:TRAP transporter 4TM/12TM fusion protein